MHSDMSALMNEMNTEVCTKYAEDSFRYLFWQQQMQASKTTNQKQMRWHPIMIRWCIFMKSKSTSGYDALRKILKLPSSRTLRDYTHIYKPQIGFQKEVDEQLCREIQLDQLAEWQTSIGILFDEMKIREGLVYNKHSSEIVGFVNLGNINNELHEFEKLCSDDQVDTPQVC